MPEKKSTAKKKITSFSLKKDYVDAIDTLAQKSNQTRTEIVESYLQNAINDINNINGKPMIITVMSFKGGVAKTTSAANLALCLGRRGKDVLIIDLDGQGSISQYLGVYDPRAEETCIADVMLNNARGERLGIADVVRDTKFEGVSIVPSSFKFSDADSRMRSEVAPGIDSRLQHAIEDLISVMHFDYLIIDCPPSLGLVVTNAITALDAGNANSLIVIPVRVDGFAIAGLSNTISTIESVAHERRTPVRKWRILRTIAETRSVAYKTGLKMIKDQFPSVDFFNTCIPKATSVVESTLAMEPLVEYDKESKPAEAYERFADEIEGLNG